MTEITKNSLDIKQAIVAWADANGYSVEQRYSEPTLTTSLHLAKGETGFEFIAENGFAYIHGEGSLNGIGTTIMDFDEFETAIASLIEARA